MPIDTPYNRNVTNQYNQLLRDKVAHEEATYQTVMPSPAGMYVNGYEPVMVGSGVGLYKKGKSCPKGHEVCTCGSGSAHGAGKAHGISATICGSGSAHGEYDRVVGGNNTGLLPAVRVELALGAGMRGDATSKHGCLDMYHAYGHGMSFNDRLKQSGMQGHEQQHEYTTFGGRICNRDMSEASIRCREGNKPPTRAGPKMPTKKTDGTLYHKSIGGYSAAHHHRHRNELQANIRNQNKATRVLGNASGKAHGGKKGFKNPLSSKAPAKGNKAPPKKNEPSPYTIDNLIKGVETAEKVGNTIGKVVPMVEGAYNYGKKLFGFAKGQTIPNDERHAHRVRGQVASGKAHGGRGLAHKTGNILKHAEKTRNEGKGKAHGKSRSEIVKKVMKEKNMSMIEASKYVKEHDLY
jgi:hypothetical protein